MNIPPPDGHATWLDYAVATMDTRSINLASLFGDGPEITRAAVQIAAMEELARLRADNANLADQLREAYEHTSDLQERCDADKH